jgi:membrane protein YqaA with SNARE-associated domain
VEYPLASWTKATKTTKTKKTKQQKRKEWLKYATILWSLLLSALLQIIAKIEG